MRTFFNCDSVFDQEWGFWCLGTSIYIPVFYIFYSKQRRLNTLKADFTSKNTRLFLKHFKCCVRHLFSESYICYTNLHIGPIKIISFSGFPYNQTWRIYLYTTQKQPDGFIRTKNWNNKYSTHEHRLLKWLYLRPKIYTHRNNVSQTSIQWHVTIVKRNIFPMFTPLVIYLNFRLEESV